MERYIKTFEEFIDEDLSEIKSNTSKAFNWFWGTSAKEIIARMKDMSDDDLIKLYKYSDLSRKGGPGEIQINYLKKEVKKRKLKVDEYMSGYGNTKDETYRENEWDYKLILKLIDDEFGYDDNDKIIHYNDIVSLVRTYIAANQNSRKVIDKVAKILKSNKWDIESTRK